MAEPAADNFKLAKERAEKAGTNRREESKGLSGNDEIKILLSEGTGESVQLGTSYGTLHMETLGRKPERSYKSEVDLSKETDLRTSLFHHLSNPITRWKDDHTPPIKMVTQLLKSICLVTQIVLLMHSPISKYPVFQQEVQDVFANFFLQPSRLPAIPVSRGNPYNTYTYHAYTTDDLKSTMNNAGRLFYQNLSLLTGAYDFVYNVSGSPRPIEVVLTQYSQAVLRPANKTYSVNGATNTTRFTLMPEENEEGTMFEQLLNACGRESCFQRLIKMDINFFLSNIRVIHSSLVHCFLVTVTLSVVPEGGGRLVYTLSADYQCDSCVEGTLSDDSEGWSVVIGCEVVLDGILLVLCMASTILTIKVIKKAFILAKAMNNFYRTHLKRSLSYSDLAHLFQYWHLINIGSDVFIASGTLLKISFSLSYSCDVLSSSTIEPARVLLGIGVVLQATVILRYTSYFQQFNALSSALNVAFPRLMKFLACVGILYLAFMLCGWVVLSPFHYKFSNYDASFYTLFSMLNGDDLWNTYTGMSSYDNNSVFVFSQFFFTIFLILFIYAVLNLFVSLIIQSYDESRHQNPHLRNEVHKFIHSCPLTPEGKALRDVIPMELYNDEEQALPEVVVHNPGQQAGQAHHS